MQDRFKHMLFASLLLAVCTVSLAADTPKEVAPPVPISISPTQEMVQILCYKCGGWGGAKDWCGKCEVCYGSGYITVPKNPNQGAQEAPAAK